MEPNSIGPWIQFGSFGLLSSVLFWIARYVIPKIVSTWAEGSANIAKALELNTRELADMKVQLARLSSIVLLHDATVKGNNDNTIGTTDELMNRVLNG